MKVIYLSCKKRFKYEVISKAGIANYIIAGSVSFVLLWLITKLFTSLRYSYTFYRYFAISIYFSAKLSNPFETSPAII